MLDVYAWLTLQNSLCVCARVVFRFGSKVITVGGAGGKLWMGYVVFLVLVNDFCQQKLACSVILAGYFRQKWDVH